MRRVGKYSMLCSVIGMMMFTSCDKEEIVLEESTDPIFVTTGQLNGESFNIVAGDDGAYMHTMTLLENGVNVFSGEISNGNLSLEMGVYDGHIDKPSHNVVNELTDFSPHFSMGYSGNYLELNKFKLCALPNSQNIEKIIWFIDGQKAGVNVALITEPGKYEVRAEVKFYGSAEVQNLTNDVIVGFKRSANCTIDFEMDQDSVVASIDAFGSSVTGVTWFLNGNEVANTHDLLLNITPERHTLTARVEMGDVVRIKSVCIDGSGAGNTINDLTHLEEGSQGSPHDYNLRLIVVKDGTVFVSESADNLNSTIQVLGVELYGENSNGNEVYKVTALISANLRSAVSEETVPISFTTTFGIEIP